jgi:hypothetical protein
MIKERYGEMGAADSPAFATWFLKKENIRGCKNGVAF